ncbi:sensor histidine kinase [Nesterenkonia sandarakina]|uniref:Two-component system sensor histidine kinase DesK n=1 Tax=Nesterenkonia sandarakina TaxID=272918 RepID=A0A2T0YJ25_9MICC|nr:histidine kinase [Nesterenkonia sandarakina]PRZ15201.1 two-component system sensor histidine kinase DesK [Nesterenkonia sandarakina]
MSSTSIAAQRRMHRATVLTTVVAIAPVALAIVAMTTESWREGLGLSLGLLATFLVLLDWDPSEHPLSTSLALAFSFVVWIVCAVLAFNPVAFFGAAMLSGVLIPQLRRRHLAWIAGLGVLIAAIGCLHLVTEPFSWGNMVRYVVVPGGLSVFVAAVILMMQGYWRILKDLEVAQEAEAELGIMRERMRFAGDLHDIQGHTLHVVNLKVALAEELLEKDPERARAELREVYDQVDETIRETKNLAYAQRKLNLSAELENAKNLLDAAGVTVRISRHGQITPGLDELLGQVLRETTTNILRHAEATEVQIRINEREVLITNDGAAEGPLPALSGLSVLRQRVADAGGQLRVEQSAGTFSTSAGFPSAESSTPVAASEPQRSSP